MLISFSNVDQEIRWQCMILFSETNLFFVTEDVTEVILSQSELNSSYLLLGMGGVTCVFLFVIILQLCKKSYSKRRENIHPVSQVENNCQSENDFERQEGNQNSCDTISYSTKTTNSPLDTKYDDINEILESRCLSFSKLSDVYERANYV